MRRCGSLKVSLPTPIRRQLIRTRASFKQCPNGQALLESLVELDGARVQRLKLEASIDSERGRGLFAVEDVAPGELLLDVPREEMFTGEGCGDGPWGAEIGVKLARLSKQESKSEVCRAWLESLPRDPLFPPLAFSREQLELISDETTRTEALNLRELMKAAFEELPAESGISWDEFFHAVSVLHGRSFRLGETHVTVPGIDLANHSFEPTAFVNIVNSPDFSQGLAALEEVCDPPKGRNAPKSVMLLIANESGIEQGEEVTISYGAWPNDIFFLLFGFVIPNNKNDAVVLFADEFALLDFIEELLVEEMGHLPQHFPEIRHLTEKFCSEQGMDFARMVVSYEGIDGRISTILDCMHSLSGSLPVVSDEKIPPISMGKVVSHRCDGLLEAYKNKSPAPGSLIYDLNLASETLLRIALHSVLRKS